MLKYALFIPVFLVFSLGQAQTSGTMHKTQLHNAGEGGYYTYRIASLVASEEGTLLAFCAARKNKGGDWDPIDIVMRRSTDNGRTWAPAQVVVSMDSLPCDNATPIVDYITGTIHMLYQINYARVFYVRSDDDGVTFSAPVDITATLEKFRETYPWVVVAPGPGHGIQMHTGRLVVPFWMSDGSGKRPGMKHHAHRPSIVVSVYSDDHGKTWQPGEIACHDNDTTVIPNETSCVQLKDGRVLLNMRNESINYRRLIACSRDGATDWSKPYYHDAFFEPICFGSMVRYSMQPDQTKDRILFCNPDSRRDPWVAENKATPRSAPNRHRTNLTVRMSYDEGHTWPVSKVLDPQIAGYSDLAVTPDGMIHCFYEGGSITGSHFKNDHMSVISFDLEWLTAGADRLDSADLPLNRPSFEATLQDRVQIGGMAFDPERLPESLTLHRDVGIITDRHVGVQMIHRTPNKDIRLYETRATKTPNGDYLLMFPEGQHYISKKEKANEMIAYRSVDQGMTWQGPTIPFDIDFNQHGFIPLIPKGSDRLYYFGTQPVWDRFSGLEDAPIGYRYSDDNGYTWSGLHLIEPKNDPDFRGMSVMRMCETSDGTWLLGSHTNEGFFKLPNGASSAKTAQYLLRSEDKGETWKVLPDAHPNGWRLPVKHGGRFEESRPIHVGGDEVLLLIRTFEGHLWLMRSMDAGKTWDEPKPTPIVHPCAPPMVFHLSDDKTLIAFHHNRFDPARTMSRDRSEIWMSISEDKGNIWSEPRFVFANALSEDTESRGWLANNCSYVDMFADGGMLHIFQPHRWRQAMHLTIDERSLRDFFTKAELEKVLR